MKEETQQQIRQALDQLDEATRSVPQLAVLALVMPHGSRGQMTVQMRHRGTDQQLSHKLYECMRSAHLMPFDLRNIIMTAAAKWLAEQPVEAKEAFDRTVERCRKQFVDTEELKAVLRDVRQVIDEVTGEDVTEEVLSDLDDVDPHHLVHQHQE